MPAVSSIPRMVALLGAVACLAATPALADAATPAGPWPPGTPVVRVAGPHALIDLFGKQEFTLAATAASGLAPRLFVERVPPKLAALPVPDKTSLFIRVLLPNLLHVNTQVEAVRKRLQSIAALVAKDGTASDADAAWLAGVAEAHGVAAGPGSAAALLGRIDTVPVSMGLAQAIDESGWGTSALARADNALFGEHGPAPGTGAYVTAAGNNVKVARFSDVFRACAGYLHTLNTAHAFAAFRALRARARAAGKTLDGNAAVATLVHYSTRGERYVADLRALIDRHRLDRFDPVRLDAASPATLILFDE